MASTAAETPSPPRTGSAGPPAPPSRLSPEDRARGERAFATYRRELPRLLQEGHARRYALIVDDEVLSIWDTAGDAAQAGYERFGVDGKFCIHELNPLDVERFPHLDAGKVRDLR